MAIDIREISLTEEQQRRIAELAEQSGRPWREVLDEQIEHHARVHESKTLVSGRYIEDCNEWLEYFNAWLARRKSYNPNFDDSRESIYP
jgi:hypothetical protein